MATLGTEKKHLCGGLPYRSSCSKLTNEKWRKESPAGGYILEGWAALLTVVVLVHAGGVAEAGNLGIGSPTVEEQRVVVPILLESGADGVAALNFRLTYDPGVFEPVNVEPGRAALGANKQVTGNMPSPGEYVVVMMGFNQTTLSGGDIARVMFRRVGEAEGGLSRITIEDTALARWDGTEMPSEGGTGVVRLETQTPDKPEPPEDPPEPDEPAAPDDEIGVPAPSESKAGSGGALLAQTGSVERGAHVEPTSASVPGGTRGTAAVSDASGLDHAAQQVGQARSEAGAYAPIEEGAAGLEVERTDISTGETNAGLDGTVPSGGMLAPERKVEPEQEGNPTGDAPEAYSGVLRRQFRIIPLAIGLLLAGVGLMLVARKWLSS